MSNVEMYSFEMRFIRDMLNRYYDAEKQRITESTANEPEEIRDKSIEILDSIRKKYNALCGYKNHEKSCSNLKNEYESAHNAIFYYLEEINDLRKRNATRPQSI